MTSRSENFKSLEQALRIKAQGLHASELIVIFTLQCMYT